MNKPPTASGAAEFLAAPPPNLTEKALRRHQQDIDRPMRYEARRDKAGPDSPGYRYWLRRRTTPG